MAKILQQDNIRYNIDNLDTKSYGVIVSDDSLLDCSNASSVKGFEITSDLPNITNCYFLFRLNSQWGKLTNAGVFTPLQISAVDFDTLQNYGNTPAELLALNNIPDFAGKKFSVAIGLSSEDLNNAVPKIKFAVKCESDSQVLTTSKFSPVYNFDSAKFIKISPDTSLSGTGKINILAAVNNSQDWRDINSLTGQEVNAIQFKADYSVSEIASANSANLNSVKFLYSVGNAITEGYTSSDLISLTQNWYMNIRDCRLTIKHSTLENSTIRAFVALRKTPTIIHGENLGIGTGSRKTFDLAHKNGVKYDSVKLYYDNVQTFENYEVNSEIGRITCNAPEGVIVSCDYEYSWDNEDWREMTLNKAISFMEYDQSEYKISIDDINLSVCAIKISLETKKGTITREIIGKGTGKTQTYKLSRKCDDGVITIYQNGSVLPAKNYLLHDDDTQYISVSANNGSTLTATYNWISESPIIYQFAAVFSE